MTIGKPMNADERRAQLCAAAQAIAVLATNREIAPQLAVLVKDDVEIRPLLETVVRRWSKLEKLSYVTVDSKLLVTTQTALDHVVPCRVLVDRMIMRPTECNALLTDAIVLARVTKPEHQRLGGIFTHHRALYQQMLQCDVSELAKLGRRRYVRSKIRLLSVQ